jgi:hypothetical protein
MDDAVFIFSEAKTELAEKLAERLRRFFWHSARTITGISHEGGGANDPRRTSLDDW